MNAVVESNFTKPHFGDIPLQSVIPSKTNPRKSFDQAKLEELAASIKSMGVAQPILVRPLPTTAEHIDCVEIVAGERRYRASKIAGMLTIPAVCRDMTDAEAMQIQIIENLQREDVHEIEEAEGFERLMKEHGHTAVVIAKAVGKSKEYVYGRLKLCALIPEARTAFYNGKLTASTALLIARIPVPALQLEATKAVSADHNDAGPMSYRAAMTHIQDRYMLDLSAAKFNIKETKLVKGAGPCVTCPKRTGAQPEVFADIDVDVCTDPNCFKSKRTAHNEKLLASAEKKGLPILEPHALWRAEREDGKVPATTNLNNFDRIAPSQHVCVRLEKLLPADALPPATAYAKLSNGDLVPIYDKVAVQAALEKAGLCETLEKHTARMNENVGEETQKTSKPTPDPAIAAKMVKDTKTADRENAVRLAILLAIRGRTDSRIALLRVFAKSLVSSNYLPKGVIEYSFDTSSDATICKHIDQVEDEQELLLLMLDLHLGHTLEISPHELQGDGGVDLDDDVYLELASVAKVCGIDIDLIRKELAPATTEEATTPDEKKIKPAKKAKVLKSVEPEPEYPADDKASQTHNPAVAWPFPTAVAKRNKSV